jgi:hypothetical protein
MPVSDKYIGIDIIFSVCVLQAYTVVFISSNTASYEFTYCNFPGQENNIYRYRYIPSFCKSYISKHPHGQKRVTGMHVGLFLGLVVHAAADGVALGAAATTNQVPVFYSRIQSGTGILFSDPIRYRYFIHGSMWIVE